MKIKNSFTLHAPMSQVWPLLTDIPTVASCIPGVGVTHEVDGVHSGSVKSKVGPVTAEYRSSAKLVACDALQRRVVLDATGHDSRGAGNVTMLVTAQMTSIDGGTRVDFSTEIGGTGKIAQLGRGVLQAASVKLLDQFVTCITQKLHAPDAQPVAMVAPDSVSAEISDHEPMDLLGAAGGAAAKRLVPVAIALVAIVVVLLIVL